MTNGAPEPYLVIKQGDLIGHDTNISIIFHLNRSLEIGSNLCPLEEQLVNMVPCDLSKWERS